MHAFKDEQMVFVATIIYLAIFFTPGDIAYKIVKLLPVYVVICSLKEILRAKKVYKGLEEGKLAMPSNGSLLFIPVLIATLKVILSFWPNRKNILNEKSKKLLHLQFKVIGHLRTPLVFKKKSFRKNVKKNRHISRSGLLKSCARFMIERSEISKRSNMTLNVSTSSVEWFFFT